MISCKFGGRCIIYIVLTAFFQYISLNIFSQPAADEYLLKTVYCAKICEFIEWPAANLGNQTDNFVLGIVGTTKINARFYEVYVKQHHKIKNHPVEIIEINNYNEITKCNLLYITSKISLLELTKILALTHDKAILTISESSGYASKGVLLNFYIESSNLRFEINTKAIPLTGLYFDSLFLSNVQVIK